MENIQFSKAETMFITDTPILTYHQITAEVPPANLRFAVSLNQFKRQMRYLHENGYASLSLTEMLCRSDSVRSQWRKTFVLTFDDGYENFYTLAYPILRSHGFTATVFLITDKIFKQNDPKREADNRYLTWEQIELLHKDDFSFGSHTCSHAMLTKLPRDAIQRELVNSKACLEARLGQEIPWLSYPYAASNSEIQNMSQEIGYRAAFGGSLGSYSTFNIRRQFCLRGESLLAFAFKLNCFFRTFERLRNDTKIGWFLRKIKHGVVFSGRLK
jgi:peptidoglycan/xylan/chitin deacetylase (PgdA/CDA1 family)